MTVLIRLRASAVEMRGLPFSLAIRLTVAWLFRLSSLLSYVSRAALTFPCCVIVLSGRWTFFFFFKKKPVAGLSCVALAVAVHRFRQKWQF